MGGARTHAEYLQACTQQKIKYKNISIKMLKDVEQKIEALI